MKTYFLLAPVVQLVKIGHSENPMARMSDLRTMNAAEVEVLTIVRDKEADLHKKFEHLRHHGEWFRIDNGMIEYLRSIYETEAADRLELIVQ